MLKNYFLTAWRGLWKNKVFSILNITGLAIGMAAAVLIFAWIQNEISYDRFHTNKANLYKLWNRTNVFPIGCWDVSSAPSGPALQQQFPEVKAYARVYWPTDRLFNYATKAITATGLDVDSPFLTMFTFPLVKGSQQHALDDVNSIVITEKLSKKIFGNADPMYRLVKINNKDTYKVTGVIKDLPNNTQFDFEYLVKLHINANTLVWNSNTYNTYIQLKPGTDVVKFGEKIKRLAFEHDPTQKNVEQFLHPINKWRLYSRFENGKIAGGRIETVRLLFIIACLILLIACINFMNLSTAQSEKRAKEVGVRKVIGANRFSIIKQFLAESMLIALVAGMLGFVLVEICLPGFNHITEKQLYINYGNPLLWLGFIGFVSFTGLLAGSYPAFFLSSFKPVKVLKATFKSPTKLVTPRKLLVVIQFTVAIVLIVSTLIIYRQIKYVQERNNGYSQINLVDHPINGDIMKNYEPIKNELINSGAVVSVCKTSLSITIDGSSTSGLHWGNMDPSQNYISFSQFATTGNFIKTVGLTLVAGRDIDINGHPADTTAMLLNQSAVKAMGLKNPIGQTVMTDNTHHVTIIGVFKDFIIGSPYQKVGPMVVFGSKSWWYNTLTFRLNPQMPTNKDLHIAEQIFKKYNPAYPFQYKFVDQEYNDKFKEELRTGTLAAIFSGLTIIISCLGLFGLAAYMSESRSKEIGIRKVLGASIANIVKLLTTEFVVLVIIAIIVAVPISWYAMSKWLQDFSYRLPIGWLNFAAAGILAIVIAVLTVSAHALKAAVANPVKSIRTE